MKLNSVAVSAAAAVCVSLPVVAQAQVQAEGQVGMGLPAPPPAAAVQGETDHDAMIGRVAVGFLGRNDVPIGTDLLGGRTNVAAPVIGIRYWLDSLIGIDAGVGFSVASESIEDPSNQTTDIPQPLAFIFHGGVPLSLSSAQHISLQIVPEVNVGFARLKQEGLPLPPGNENTFTGFHLDVGARAGGEIHFGFMGIPQLSLQGSVGVNLAIDRTEAEAVTPVLTQSASHNTTTFRTTVGDNPWNIFLANVAAFYYF
jgi:hypothetical protein